MNRTSLVTEDGRVLLPPEAKALELGCSLPTLWRKVRAGEFQAIRIRGRTWFESSAQPTKRRRTRKVGKDE
ncbi:MAG: hypothetical protein RL701_6963 [Pseudomonadota bacterium]|jgi:hypothetical protein